MTQPHRKGHKSKNKSTKRLIERKQRQRERLYLAGKKIARRKKKPKATEKAAKERQAYPCSAKQYSLGELPPRPETQQ